MALAFTFVAAAMFIAAGVNAQCPVCDPNNGAQTVCVQDQTTGALQQFISLCEMDLFNCQQNQNVFTPLYYGACQTQTVPAPTYTYPTYTYPTYTNQVPWYSSVGAPSYYPVGTPSYYYGNGAYPATAGAAQQPNYMLSGTDPNGDWSVRLLSRINPAYFATSASGIYQRSGTANTNLVAQKSSDGSAVPVGTKTLTNSVPPTNTIFSSLAGKTGYQAGAVYNFAQQNGGGGGYAVGSKSGVAANSVGTNIVGTAASKLGGTPSPVSPAKFTTNVVAQKPWASNKGPVVGVPSVLGARQG